VNHSQPNTFFYHDDEWDELEIHTALRNGETDYTTAYVRAGESGTYVARKDAPAVARALLKAAGAKAIVVDVADTIPPIPAPPAIKLPTPFSLGIALPEADLKPYHSILDTVVASMRRAADRHSIRQEAPVFANLPASFSDDVDPSAACHADLDVYVYVDEDGDRMIIEEAEENGAYLKSYDSGVNISKDDAVSVALALLERAGWPEKDTRVDNDAHSIAMARFYLRKIEIRLAEEKVKDEAVKAAKAEEAKLDAEALKLYAAAYNVSPAPVVWGAHVDYGSRERWRLAARKAREIHAGGTK